MWRNNYSGFFRKNFQEKKNIFAAGDQKRKKLELVAGSFQRVAGSVSWFSPCLIKSELRLCGT
jgi:hypothetical protein